MFLVCEFIRTSTYLCETLRQIRLEQIKFRLAILPPKRQNATSARSGGSNRGESPNAGARLAHRHDMLAAEQYAGEGTSLPRR